MFNWPLKVHLPYILIILSRIWERRREVRGDLQGMEEDRGGAIGICCSSGVSYHNMVLREGSTGWRNVARNLDNHFFLGEMDFKSLGIIYFVKFISTNKWKDAKVCPENMNFIVNAGIILSWAGQNSSKQFPAGHWHSSGVSKGQGPWLTGRLYAVTCVWVQWGEPS